MAQKHAEDRVAGLTWSVVSGVQPVVYVARVDDKAVAVLEMRPTREFRLTTCRGERLGEYHSTEQGMAALEEWLAFSARR
jgi:hypothetical protein